MAKYSILNDDADNKKNTDLELYYFGTQQCRPNESWGPGSIGVQGVQTRLKRNVRFESK